MSTLWISSSVGVDEQEVKRALQPLCARRDPGCPALIALDRQSLDGTQVNGVTGVHQHVLDRAPKKFVEEPVVSGAFGKER